MLSRRLIAFLPALPVFAVGAWVIGYSSQMFRADTASASARYHVSGWANGRLHWNIEDWVDARDGLREAIRIMPDNAMNQDFMGALYVMRGNIAAHNVEVRKIFFSEALPYQQKSLELRPHNAGAWSNYAYTLYMLGVRDERLQEAERNAIALGQYETGIRRTLQDIVLTTWYTQPADIQTWMRQSVCEMNHDARTRLDKQTDALGIARLTPQNCDPATRNPIRMGTFVLR